MASRGMASGKRPLFSKYEEARGITVHPRPYTVVLKQHGKVVTFVDTSGHFDFLEETLEVLKRVDNVVIVVNALEGLETTHAEILRAIEGKNTVLVFNRIDTIITELTAEELFRRISSIASALKPHGVFLGSMADKWICNVESVRNSKQDSCMLKFLIEPLYKIYSTKFAKYRTLKRALKKFIRNEDSMLSFMNSTALNEGLYVLKHYYVDNMLLPLVFSGMRIDKHLELVHNGRTVKIVRVFVSLYGALVETDSIAPNIPSFVKFDTKVPNSALVGKEPGEIEDYPEKDASCFKVFVESTTQLPLCEALDTLKLMYISLYTRDNVLYGTGELFLDCVLHDLLDISDSMRVIAFDIEFKETCTAGRFSEPSANGNIFDIVCEGIEYNAAKTLGSKSLRLHGCNVLQSNSCIGKDVLESIVSGFKWAACGNGQCGDPMFLTKVVLQNVVVTDARSSVIVKDAREAILNAFERGSKALEPFLSISVFYKDYVEDAVREILNRHFVNVSEEGCVGSYRIYKGVVSCVDSLGLEASLLWNTFEEAFCVKRFLGYKDPSSFCNNAFLSRATDRLQKHRQLNRDMQDIF